MDSGTPLSYSGYTCINTDSIAGYRKGCFFGPFDQCSPFPHLIGFLCHWVDPSFLLPINTDSIAGVDSGTPPSYSGYLTVPNTNRECQTESRKGFLGWTGYHIFHICLLCIAIYTTMEFIFIFDMIQLCDRMFDRFWISDFCFCVRVSEVGGKMFDWRFIGVAYWRSFSGQKEMGLEKTLLNISDAKTLLQSQKI